jgi:hypothetical protein
MAGLDLGNANVFEQSLTIDEIRDEDQNKMDALWIKVTQWLDEAQAPVFTGEHSVAYLVIEITQ